MDRYKVFFFQVEIVRICRKIEEEELFLFFFCSTFLNRN